MSQTQVADGDYHGQIGFPDVRLQTGTFDLEPTRHAAERSNNHKYGPFEIPDSVTVSAEDYERDAEQAVEDREPHVFEVTVKFGNIEKFGYREPLDSERDICLIIDPLTHQVRTAWINHTDDPHETLNTDKYRKP